MGRYAIDCGSTAEANYVQYARVTPFTPPFTMCCWFLATDTTSAHTLMSVGKSGSDNSRHILYARGDLTRDPINVFTSSDTGGLSSAYTGVTSTGYIANTWTHAAGVWAATDLRIPYINGIGPAGDTKNLSVTGCDLSRLGLRAQAAAGLPLGGMIADSLYYNRDLAPDELTWLANPANRLYVPDTRRVVWFPSDATTHLWPWQIRRRRRTSGAR